MQCTTGTHYTCSKAAQSWSPMFKSHKKSVHLDLFQSHHEYCNLNFCTVSDTCLGLYDPWSVPVSRLIWSEHTNLLYWVQLKWSVIQILCMINLFPLWSDMEFLCIKIYVSYRWSACSDVWSYCTQRYMSVTDEVMRWCMELLYTKIYVSHRWSGAVMYGVTVHKDICQS